MGIVSFREQESRKKGKISLGQVQGLSSTVAAPFVCQ
jgi:hypothetical protein